MRELTVDELKTIIENHGHWLRKDCDGWENMRADLSDALLSGANLSGANLTKADLSDAHLSGANLAEANLSDANLARADLTRADLTKADLFSTILAEADLTCADLTRADLTDAIMSLANLTRADLTRADLTKADLSYALLSWANLTGTNLTLADLTWADLTRADLSGANLTGANLSGANLKEAENVPFVHIACPDTGSFIAWKKVCGYIVKLQVPEDAKRCSATSRKCRCDKALVLAIENLDGTNSGKTMLTNTTYAECVYTVGEMVYPDSWDDNRWNECSHGIHFFVNRQEAVNW